jgi:ribokinase
VGRVVVIGSANTDMTVRVPRIPASGETVLGGGFQMSGGGKGANQAVAAARAGGRVLFVAALGDDDFGSRALESFQRERIDVRFVRRVAAPSGVALIFVDDRGENCIAVAPGANHVLRPGDVGPVAAALEAEDVVLLQLEIPIETVEAAARAAAARQARVILNPAPARALSDTLLSSVSLLTPNEVEIAQLTGVAVGDEPSLNTAAAVLRARGVRDVVVTLGARGAYASGDGRSGLVPAFAVAAVDTTAAGDVFNGALAVALVEGRALDEAIEFAGAAAALSVTRPGAQASAPRREEIDLFLHQHGPRTRTT